MCFHLKKQSEPRPLRLCRLRRITALGVKIWGPHKLLTVPKRSWKVRIALKCCPMQWDSSFQRLMPDLKHARVTEMRFTVDWLMLDSNNFNLLHVIWKYWFVALPVSVLLTGWVASSYFPLLAHSWDDSPRDDAGARSMKLRHLSSPAKPYKAVVTERNRSVGGKLSLNHAKRVVWAPCWYHGPHVQYRQSLSHSKNTHYNAGTSSAIM